MRPSQKQNRSRGRGNRKPNGNNLNRVYESAGPEGKVRGTPQQIIDKYLTLARDAQTSGDRVVAENFLQHAEHYQRIMLEAMGSRPDRRDHLSEQDQPDIDGQDDDDDGDSDRDIEAEPVRAVPMGRPEDAGGEYRGRRPQRNEVSGLTTIDSGVGDGGSLLVDAEEISASQPRRRRRPAAPEAEPAPAEADTQPE
jgi:hypothetical protein